MADYTSGLLSSPWDTIRDLGFGLLANSGPSFQPQSPASMLGKAGQYAAERRDQGVLNEARRVAIQQTMLENQGTQALRDYITANPDFLSGNPATRLGLQYFPKETLSSLSNPLLGLQALQAQQTIEQKGGEIGAQKADLSNIYKSSSMAQDAVQFLKTVPGGETIATNPSLLPVLRQMKAGGWDKTLVGKSASWLLDVPRDQWGPTLDAAEAIEKARNAITNAKSNQAGVVGLQSRLLSMGEGAGLNLQGDLFTNAVDQAKEASTGYKDYSLPELSPELFPWRRGQQQTPPAGGTGFSPQAGLTAQPSPSTAITPQPGVPQRTPVQASTVGTLPLNAAGVPTFKGWADVQRAEQNGLLRGATSITVNGKIYDWVQ